MTWERLRSSSGYLLSASFLNYYTLSEKELEALRTATENAGFDSNDEQLKAYIEADYLTINTGRNGRSYAWYMDANRSSCVDVETLEELTPKQIDEQLV